MSQARSSQGDHPYGFARPDAIVHEATVSARHVPGNRKPANAPVSYPLILDTPLHG